MRAPLRRLPVLAAAVIGVGMLAVACGAPPGPAGWAPARPVKVDSSKLILVPHRAKLFALPDGSTNPAWQFPPKDKDPYPVSTDAHDRIAAIVEKLGVDDAVKTDLKRKVDDLSVGGASRGVLKDAVDATGASQEDKDTLKSLVDSATKFERGALDNLQALYGDIGISSDGKTAYVPTFKGILFAIDVSTGRTRWVRDAGAGLVGGVAVDGNRLYVGTKSNRVYQIDAATGASTWQATTKGEVWATPTIDGNIVYVTSLDGSLYALDKSTGERKWTFDSASSGIAGRAVVVSGTVYVGAFDNKLYAINASDGTQKWSTSASNWFWATPIVSGGKVFAASLDGKVYAVDATSGEKVWDKPFDTGAPVRSAPAMVGASLIVASKDGKVYKLDSGSGVADGDPIQPATKIQSDLTVDGTTVYINPDQATLLTLDIRSGALEAPGSFPLPK